jgi:hypothetical protein
MEYHSYIARRRARFKSCDGQQVNIPFGSVLENQGGFLMWHGVRACVDTSQNAYDFFSQNDDGKGLERGKLVGAIVTTLKKQDEAHQHRWNKVWSDKLCQKYKRPEHEDYWIWSFDFYNAPVEDLRYIAGLVGAKVKP